MIQIILTNIILFICFFGVDKYIDWYPTSWFGTKIMQFWGVLTISSIPAMLLVWVWG